MDLSGKGELFSVWGDIKFLCVCFYISSKRTGFYTDLFAICIILYLIGMGNSAEKYIVVDDVSERKPLNGSHVVLQFSSPVNRGYCFRIQF